MPDISHLSAVKLRRLIAKTIADEPEPARSVLQQNIDNAILSMFLDGIGVLKGGGSLSLRYSPAEGRMSRDLDAAIRDDMDSFIAELARRLRKGCHGFTGVVEPQSRGDTDGIRAGMRPFDVALKYNGGSFTTLEFEASPDHSGFISDAAPAIDPKTLDVLRRIGLDIEPPLMLDPLDQLADKLHAVSKPGRARGRDLADIARIVQRSKPLDLDDLRRRVRNVEQCETVNPHAVHMLENGNEFESRLRASFEATKSSADFDECLALTQFLLKQVDEDYQGEWVASWD